MPQLLALFIQVPRDSDDETSPYAIASEAPPKQHAQRTRKRSGEQRDADDTASRSLCLTGRDRCLTRQQELPSLNAGPTRPGRRNIVLCPHKRGTTKAIQPSVLTTNDENNCVSFRQPAAPSECSVIATPTK